MDGASIYNSLRGNDVAQGFTTTGCRVPLDVVELVMEQFASIGAIGALRRCSLVCRDFAMICQKHIFTDVILSNKGGDESRSIIFPLTSFRKALDNKPYLEGYVRILDYCHDFDYHTQWPPVLRRLRHIQSLRIWFLAKERMSWSGINSSFKSSFSRFIRTNQITHLDLYLIPDLPTHVFALVPCLEILKMSRVTLDNDPPFFQKTSPKLQALRIGANGEQPVDTLIASQNGIVDLRALKYLDVDMGSSPALMGVIRRLLQQSEVLESLKFEGSLPELDFHENLARYLPNKSLESLKSIELIIELVEAEDDPYLNLTSELEKLSGRNVLENLIILIMVPIYSTCNTETSRWSELDRVLSQPSAFPRLHRVQITMDITYFFDSDRNKEMERKLAVICDEAFTWLKESTQVKFVVSLDISPLD